MRKDVHVQKFEAPLKRSIRDLFISIKQLIPGQVLSPVPYPNFSNSRLSWTQLCSPLRPKVIEISIKQSEI